MKKSNVEIILYEIFNMGFDIRHSDATIKALTEFLNKNELTKQELPNYIQGIIDGINFNLYKFSLIDSSLAKKFLEEKIKDIPENEKKKYRDAFDQDMRAMAVDFIENGNGGEISKEEKDIFKKAILDRESKVFKY